MSEDVEEKYAKELLSLRINSKPLINSLTMMAEDFIQSAPVIVRTIEKHLAKIRPESRLPVLYLIDSIIKNVKKEYVELFSQNIVTTFCSVFEADTSVRGLLHKLRLTWVDVFPMKKLMAIDLRCSDLDDDYPIGHRSVYAGGANPNTANTIHVNPKFLNSGHLRNSNLLSLSAELSSFSVEPSSVQDLEMKKELISKQKRLIELQEKKLELELLEKRVNLEEQARRKKQQDEEANAKLLAQAELAKQKTQAATSIMARANVMPHLPPSKDSDVSSLYAKPQSTTEVYHVPRNPVDVVERVSRNPELFPTDPRIRRSVILHQQQAVPVRRITPWNSDHIQSPRVLRNPTPVPADAVSVTSPISPKSPPSTPKPNRTEKETVPKNSEDRSVTLIARPDSKEFSDSYRRSESKSPKEEHDNLVGKIREAGMETHETECGRRSDSEEKLSPRRYISRDISTPSVQPSLSQSPEKELSERRRSRGDSKSSHGSRKSNASEKDFITSITTEKDSVVKLSPERYSKSSKEKRSSHNDRDGDTSNRSFSSSVSQESPSSNKKRKGSRNEQEPSSRSKSRDTKVFTDIDLRFDNVSSSYGNNNGVKREDKRREKESSKHSRDKDGKKNRRSKQERKSSVEVDARVRSESRKAEREKQREAEREQFKNRTSAVLARNYRKRSGIPEVEELEKLEATITDIDQRCDKDTKDVDLRKASIQSDKSEAPSAKKSRASTLIDNLFGLEDVDLRHSSSWSQMKKSNEDSRRDSSDSVHATSEVELKDMLRDGKLRPPPALSPASSVGSTAANSCDALGRPLAFARLPDDPEERRRSLGNRSLSIDPVEAFRSRYIETPLRMKGNLDPSDLEVALSRSKEQMDQGTLSSSQFNVISKELVQLNEGIKIRQVQEMDTNSRTGPGHLPSPWNQDANPVWASGMPGFPRPAQPMAVVRPDGPMWARGGPLGVPRGPNPFIEAINPNPVPQIVIPVANTRDVSFLEQDMDGTTPLDKIPRQVRFYGDTAIVFTGKLSDEPKEISFIPEDSQRTVFINGEPLKIRWGVTRKFYYNKKSHNICIGAPTRELYIDGVGYEVYFGSVDARIKVDNQWARFRLAGPPPGVKIGTTLRYDLVAGRTTVFVDGNPYTLYLDEKPQILDFGGFPVISQFCDEFGSMLFNGIPFSTSFGGPPRPVGLPNGRRLYVRFNAISPLAEQNIMTYLRTRDQRLGLVAPGPRLRDPFMPGFNPNPLPGFPLPAQELPSSTNPLDMVANLLAPPNNVKEPGVLDNSYEIEPSNQENNVPKSTAEEDAVSSGPLNVQDLLNKLLLAGLLPTANKSKEEVKVVKAEDQTKTDTKEQQVPETKVTETQQHVQPKVEPILPPTPTVEPVNVSLSDNLKTRRPKLIDALYVGIQCGSCGIRFPADQNYKYTQHLDWHFRRNRREKANSRKALSRKWYYDLSDWIQFEEIEDLEERAVGVLESQDAELEDDKSGGARLLDPDSYTVLAAGFEGVNCPLCGEGFETFYDEEKEEWRLRDAMIPPDSTETPAEEKKVFHPICHQDYLNSLVEDDEPKVEPVPEEEDEVQILREGPKEVVLAELDIAEEEEKVKEDGVDAKSHSVDLASEVESSTIASSNPTASYVVLSPVVIDVVEDENSNIPGIAMSDEREGGVFGFALNSSQTVTTPAGTQELRPIIYEPMKFDFPKIKQEPVEWQDISEDQIIMSNLFPHMSQGTELMDITLDDEDSMIDDPSSPPIPDSLGIPITVHDIDLTEDDSELSRSTQHSVFAEIDGNVHFRATEVPKGAPAKIKINIFGLDTSSQSQSPTHKGMTGEDSQGAPDSLKPTTTTAPTLQKSQSPIPPNLESLFKTEEIRRLKPKLAAAGKKLVNNPVKRTGREESGLCSIM